MFFLSPLIHSKCAEGIIFPMKTYDFDLDDNSINGKELTRK
jgi:hypothetical protein